MSNENLFTILSYIPGPFWLMILFLPNNKKAMIAVDIFLFLMSGLFVFQAIPVMGELFPLLAQPEFPKMYAFLSSEKGVLGSWNHMILSDVWIGRWIAKDSLQFEKSIIIRIFIIPIIMFFGPVGLFCYLVFRVIVKKSFYLLE
ncbi:MAG: DUF4281 domain-containing protein [Leptospiraceae bacterium]|nr:DUF4281 domain-containing protein [Leptospiraceae bacterium]